MPFLLVFFLFNCSETSVEPASIEPSDANALSKVIVFTGDTKTEEGKLPTSSTPTTYITNNPSVSLTTGGSNVYIPLQYTGNTPLTAVYIQIVGSNTIFKIPVSGANSSGLIYIPLSLPISVNQGDFALQVVLIGQNGNVVLSTTLTIPVEVTLPKECGDGSVSGSSGITQTEHKLGGKSGNVSINYRTYSLPDRIDVYLDNVWVAGTGSNIPPPPPLSTCRNPLAGFVGKSGVLTINVGSSNKIVQVYVSGCTGNATAWDYNLTCP